MTFTTSRAGRVDSCLAFCRQWQLRLEQARWCHVNEALIYSRPPVNNVTHIRSLKLCRPRFLSCNVVAVAHSDNVAVANQLKYQLKDFDGTRKRGVTNYERVTNGRTLEWKAPRDIFFLPFLFLSIFWFNQPPTGRRFYDFLTYLKVNGDGSFLFIAMFLHQLTSGGAGEDADASTDRVNEEKRGNRACLSVPKRTSLIA